MKRRHFLKNIFQAAAISPFIINGLPMTAFGKAQAFQKLTQGPYDDRIMVMIQLDGGNDGLNTIVPLNQYTEYSALRTLVGLPETGTRAVIELDNTLPANQQVGLHPDMPEIKDLYDDDLVSIVQGVGYDNHNKSHFRSRDIWWMGSSYDEYKNSGWMGRYLDHLYPNYPVDYPSVDMPDPLGLQIGTTVALGFNRESGIPMALATRNPNSFADLISGVGGPQPTNIPNNNYGDELQHILSSYNNANNYASQLESRYNSGTNNVVYPQWSEADKYPYATGSDWLKYNDLGWQLQTVARLINSGSKTRIYLVRIGGFDSHDKQVEQGDPTIGNHGALMYNLSRAIKAFQDDLTISGKDEKVVTFTFSEFGRRPYDNGSYGTDHGTSAPMMVIGKGVVPGIIGNNSDLTNFDSTGNLLIQHDYRQIFTTILSDWMGADTDAIAATQFTDFMTQKLPIIKPSYNANTPVLPITMTSFKGWYDGRFNQLEWITVSEQNNERFDIMRSRDGKDFSKIGTLDGAGDSEEINTYNFTDKQPFYGDNYYQLQQVDFDGKTTLSSIIHLKNSAQELGVQIYPNPVSTHLRCTIFSPEFYGNIKVRVTSMTGQQIKYLETNFMQGTNNFSLPMDNVPQGAYVLTITDGQRILKTERFLKQ